MRRVRVRMLRSKSCGAACVEKLREGGSVGEKDASEKKPISGLDLAVLRGESEDVCADGNEVVRS